MFMCLTLVVDIENLTSRKVIFHVSGEMYRYRNFITEIRVKHDKYLSNFIEL